MIDEMDDIATSMSLYSIEQYAAMMLDEIKHYAAERGTTAYGLDLTSPYRATLPRTVSIWYACPGGWCHDVPGDRIHGAIFGPYPGGKPGCWAD